MAKLVGVNSHSLSLLWHCSTIGAWDPGMGEESNLIRQRHPVNGRLAKKKEERNFINFRRDLSRHSHIRALKKSIYWTVHWTITLEETRNISDYLVHCMIRTFDSCPQFVSWAAASQMVHGIRSLWNHLVVDYNTAKKGGLRKEI